MAVARARRCIPRMFVLWPSYRQGPTFRHVSESIKHEIGAAAKERCYRWGASRFLYSLLQDSHRLRGERGGVETLHLFHACLSHAVSTMHHYREVYAEEIIRLTLIFGRRLAWSVTQKLGLAQVYSPDLPSADSSQNVLRAHNFLFLSLRSCKLRLLFTAWQFVVH